MNTLSWTPANVAVSFGADGLLPHLVAWRDHYFEITGLKRQWPETDGLQFLVMAGTQELSLFFNNQKCCWYIDYDRASS